MSFFGRSELGDTNDPVELVPGSVATLEETANGLRKLSTACQEAYHGVSKLDVGHWTGEAAEKFGGYFRAETPKWRDAAEAFAPAVDALTTYKGAVERAQREAAEAIRMYNESKAETEAAEKQYDAASSQHEKASLDAFANGDAMPGPLAPFSDPGKAKREQAERLLADARKALKAAASEAASVINKAKDRAPEEPGFLSKVSMTAEDTFDKMSEQMEKLGDGLGRSVTSLVTLLRATSPFDPYNIAHPGEYAANMMKQASGMVHMVTHPVEAFKGIINADGWSKDPFGTAGQLIGDIAIGIATDGAGLAATAEKAIAREAMEAAAREATEQAATQVGKHIDDGMPPWTRGDYEPPAHTPDYGNPHTDEPFGPQKTDPDDLPSHDREPEHREPDQPAEQQKHEPDERPRITDPDQLPPPAHGEYFRLKDSVGRMQDMIPQLPPLERDAMQRAINEQRQMMRDIMARHA
ncbi:putative T7SS-secreted protein [Lentzea sp. NPDC051838]|uniref:putative T7SS-secreted protein n=1 Tax=Lentzea sp. NPDC051838 TaxID=3154849 RepID=UPI0034289F65